MKKFWKNMFIMFLISIFLISSVSFASEEKSTGISDAASEIQERGNTILSAIMWVGYAVSLGMVVYIGIKYILGAAEAKANMKSAIVNWLIGAFMVFMCTTIIGWVISATGIKDEAGLADQIIDAAG